MQGIMESKSIFPPSYLLIQIHSMDKNGFKWSNFSLKPERNGTYYIYIIYDIFISSFILIFLLWILYR